MNAPWLFAEAYKYRRLRECFAVSKYWQHYDVFFRQKARLFEDAFGVTLTLFIQCDTFARSEDAVFELSMRFAESWKLPEGSSEEQRTERQRLMFQELSQGKYLYLTCVSI